MFEKKQKQPYRVKTIHAIHEVLILENAKGEDTLQLEVDLHIDDILQQYDRIRRILGEAQAELAMNPASEVCQSKYATAVIALFELVFGKAQSDQILAFYENRYTEMLLDVAPFISDVITPQVNRAMQEQARRAKKIKR